MLVKSYAAAVQGISATVITIEVNCTKGIQFFLVGLPDVAVRESHERIISALQVSGYKFPRNRIVINMAPADIRKEGSSYDLPLAIGILQQPKSWMLPARPLHDDGRAFIGRQLEAGKGNSADCDQGA